MSEDKFYKNFPRTGKRYGTLLQITPNQVNLTSNLHLKYIFDKTQKYTKPIHSVYSLQILDDILPDINSNKRNKEERRKPLLPQRASSASKVISRKPMIHSLEKIEEEKVNKRNIIKLYQKSCDIKKHVIGGKFISHFLTPLNNFISKDFKLYNEEYEKLINKLHKNVKKKIKRLPPRVPIRKEKTK